MTVTMIKCDLFHPEEGVDLRVTADLAKGVGYVYVQPADGSEPEYMYWIPRDLYDALVRWSEDPLHSRVPYKPLDAVE